MDRQTDRHTARLIRIGQLHYPLQITIAHLSTALGDHVHKEALMAVTITFNSSQ